MSACLFILGPSAGAAFAGDNAVRIGTTRDLGAASLYIADANGYFRGEGLDAELKFFDSEQQVKEAASQGAIDFGVSRLDASFFDAAAKGGLKIVASEVSDQSLYPIDGLLTTKKTYREALRDPHNFPKLRIGVAAGFDEAGARYSLARIAAKFKFAPDALHLTQFGTFAEGAQALSRGDIDLMVMPYATARQMVDSLDDGLIARFTDYIERQAGVAFTRAELIGKDRDRVERFIRAYRRGVAEYDLSFQLHDENEILPGPNYKQYLELMARQTGLPESIVQTALPYCDHLARLDVTDLGRQLRFWQAAGKADKAISVAQIFDASFFEHINLPETAY